MKFPNCKKKITAQSTAALLKSDIGLNTTIIITYLWVWPAMSLPKISDYLNSFFVMKISNSGISKMMIRVGNILGSCFQGLLISDAWHAYLKLQCEKQTCMAHIFRKVRAFRDAFPRHYSIVKFYEKLRKIIADGEALQSKRDDIPNKNF